MWLNSIKRRFSTEVLDDDNQQPVQAGVSPTSAARNTADKPVLSLNMNAPPKMRKNPSPSAPSSPTKTLSLSAVMSAAKDLIATNTSSVTSSGSSSTGGGGLFSSATLPLNRGSNTSTTIKRKILLIIDDAKVDWSKYFRNKRIGDYDLRIEQTEFKDMNLASYVDSGTIVDIVVDNNGSKVMRSFKPDFLLIRQHVRNLGDDWSNLIIGFKYGLIPSVNSLDSIYNFRDKPWVFSELIKLSHKHGHEAFPLINQTYYPNYKEMVRTSFPCVVKVGNYHQGLGKIQVRNALDFQDITSIVSSTHLYSTCEPFCESKYDIQIQKVGNHYKAYMKKSITSNWKSNTGSSMLEQIPMTDRYRFWIDEVSKLFGGLDMCTVQAIVEASSGKEYIIDVCDCAFTLLGEQLDGDRKLIADLVYEKMLTQFLQPIAALAPGAAESSHSAIADQPVSSTNLPKSSSSSDNMQLPQRIPTSQTSTPPVPLPQQAPKSSAPLEQLAASSSTQPAQPQSSTPIQQQQPQANIPSTSISGQQRSQQTKLTKATTMGGPSSQPPVPPVPPAPLSSSQSQASTSSSSQPIPQKKPPLGETKTCNEGAKKTMSFSALDDAEDTMNNLRKTFAGIFGNANI